MTTHVPDRVETPPSTMSVDQARIAGRLLALVHTRDAADAMIPGVIAELRAAGGSWGAVGWAIRRSRTAAQWKYGPGGTCNDRRNEIGGTVG